MSTTGKLLIVVVLVALVGLVVGFRRRAAVMAPAPPAAVSDTDAAGASLPAAAEPTAAEVTTSEPEFRLPQLIDLGSTTCVPCRLMAPILAELQTEYAGKLKVTFIDTDRLPSVADAYRVTVNPTQVFLDANNVELFRHEGFMSKEDIIAKWAELGINLRMTVLPAETLPPTPPPGQGNPPAEPRAPTEPNLPPAPNVPSGAAPAVNPPVRQPGIEVQ